MPQSNAHSRRLPYLLIGVLLSVDVASFVCEKIACSRAGGDGLRLLLSMPRQPLFWAALALAPVQLWTWTRILGRLELSVAYPISALSMPLALIAATFVLREQLPWEVWLGAVLITLGGAIIGPGADKKPGPTVI